MQSPEASAEAAAEVLRGTRGKWALIGALAASAPVDAAYIEHWADAFGVLENWRTARPN